MANRIVAPLQHEKKLKKRKKLTFNLLQEFFVVYLFRFAFILFYLLEKIIRKKRSNSHLNWEILIRIKGQTSNIRFANDLVEKTTNSNSMAKKKPFGHSTNLNSYASSNQSQSVCITVISKTESKYTPKKMCPCFFLLLTNGSDKIR